MNSARVYFLDVISQHAGKVKGKDRDAKSR